MNQNETSDKWWLQDLSELSLDLFLIFTWTDHKAPQHKVCSSLTVYNSIQPVQCAVM